MNPARLVADPGFRNFPMGNRVFRGYLMLSPQEEAVVAGRIAIRAVEIYTDCVAFIWRYAVNLEEFGDAFRAEVRAEEARLRADPRLGPEAPSGPAMYAAGLVVRQSMRVRDDADTVYLSSWEHFGGNVGNLDGVEGKRAYRPTVPDTATQLELSVLGATFQSRLD